MAEKQEQEERERVALARYCFVHRVAELPLIAASVQQFLHFYDKTKNYNRLVGGSLQLAESSVRLAFATTEPILKLFDGPIVATSKIACQQLDKLETTFPVLKTTPDELINGSKAYYERSIVKSGVDKAQSVVEYGREKARSSRRLADNIVDNVVYIGHLSLFDLFNLGFKAANQTLVFSDNLIDTYIAPPGFERFNNNDEINIRSMVNRLWYMSNKIYSGVKYKAGTSVAFTKDQALQVLAQMQATFTLIDYVKNTANWMTDEAINNLSMAQSQAAALLRGLKTNAQQFGRRPDQALLKLLQSTSSTFVAFSDFLYRRSLPYLSEKLNENFKTAVQYAHDLNDVFNEATTLGELRGEVISEAREKFQYIEGILLSFIDQLASHPPISWLAAITPHFIVKSLTSAKTPQEVANKSD